MKYFKTIALLSVFVAATSLTHAADKPKDTCPEKCPIPKVATSASFDLIKSLAGTWKGTWVENGKKEPMKVVFKVTSGGTAVEETIFPGTPKEMISMYTLDDGKVKLTHYCMIGNQPNMLQTKAEKNSVQLDFVKTKGINPKKDMFMSGILLVKKDEHHLTYSGSGMMKGKPMPHNPIELTR